MGYTIFSEGFEISKQKGMQVPDMLHWAQFPDFLDKQGDQQMLQTLAQRKRLSWTRNTGLQQCSLVRWGATFVGQLLIRYASIFWHDRYIRQSWKQQYENEGGEKTWSKEGEQKPLKGSEKQPSTQLHWQAIQQAFFYFEKSHFNYVSAVFFIPQQT